MPGDEPLIVTMFQSLERHLERVGDRLDEADEWMRRADGHMQDLTAKVAIQNGGVKRALTELTDMQAWKHSHDADTLQLAARLEGRRAQRADDLAKVDGLRDFAKEWLPLIVGAILSITGLGAFAWGRWPW